MGVIIIYIVDTNVDLKSEHVKYPEQLFITLKVQYEEERWLNDVVRKRLEMKHNECDNLESIVIMLRNKVISFLSENKLFKHINNYISNL